MNEESSAFQYNGIKVNYKNMKRSNLVRIIQTPWQNSIDKSQSQFLLTQKSFLNQTYIPFSQQQQQLQVKNLNNINKLEQGIDEEYQQQQQNNRQQRNSKILNPQFSNKDLFYRNKIDFRSLSPIKAEIEKYNLKNLINQKPKLIIIKQSNCSSQEQNKSSQSLKLLNNSSKNRTFLKLNSNNNSPGNFESPLSSPSKIGLCNCFAMNKVLSANTLVGKRYFSKCLCSSANSNNSSSNNNNNSKQKNKSDQHQQETHELVSLQHLKQQQKYNNQNETIPNINNNINNNNNNNNQVSAKKLNNINTLNLKTYSINNNNTSISTNNSSSSSSTEKSSNKRKCNNILIKKLNTDNMINQIKEIFDEDEDLPQISAKHWTVFNCKTQKSLYGKKSQKQVEIASLTKIMTCLVVCQFFQRHDLDLKNYNVVISKLSSSQIGTSAELQKGDIITLLDLVYGLMLPSGNDAAVALAEAVGLLLIFEELNEITRIQDTKYIDIKCRIPYNSEELMRQFIREMNKLAIYYGLERTNFASVNGLVNNKNVSTAKDLAKLSKFAMDDQYFKNIVKTQSYSCTVQDKDFKARVINWQNTNKLLEEGFEGIKTGITDAAGPCLASSFRIKKADNKNEEVHLIVILLNCKSMDQRWDDCKAIIKWSLQKYFQIFI